MTNLERARQHRKLALMTAETLPDDKAAEIPSLYPEWKPNKPVAANDRRYYPATDKLYKCIQPHTTQSDWTPDLTPALWEVLDITHAGTLEDPIPAALNMQYYKDKYYIETEKRYRCTRDSEIPLSYLPSQLVGQYFEEVI